MSLSNPNKVVTEERLSEFYGQILPYLGGTAEAGFTPVGTIISVMGNSAPANYLTCNGQIVNIADYPILADYFEQQFGNKNYFGGNGTTTFAVPDLRGEFLRGAGTNSHVNPTTNVKQGDGAAVGNHQNSTEIPFSITYSDHSFYTKAINSSAFTTQLEQDATLMGVAGTNWSNKYNPQSNYADNTAQVIRYSTRPTNTSVLYCIATHNIYLNPAMDYSTEEQVVGHWINGKPIYQRSYECGAMPNATTKTVPLNITNLDKVINLFGIWGKSIGYPMYQINYTYQDSMIRYLGCYVDSSKNIYFISNANLSAYDYSCVTVQYTKTTD